MNFKEIYEKSLKGAPKRSIASSHFLTKPVMEKGIISPESRICILHSSGIEFGLDQEGMSEIIEMLQNRWDSKPEAEKKQLLSILTDIYSIADEYLGGRGNESKRQLAYIQADDTYLTLSDIKGENIGICAERTAIGHQLLSILEQAGIINFESFFTNGYLTTDNKMPHAFIVLKHKIEQGRQYIFDIQNPTSYKINENDNSRLSIALFSMTDQEYEAFKEGKSISPQSVYEQFGWTILDKKRFYGNETIREEKERTEK